MFSWIATGFIAGLLARAVVRDDKQGCVWTIVVGVLGALIGGALMQAATGHGIDDFDLGTMVVAFLGACLLLAVLGALSAGGARRRRRR